MCCLHKVVQFRMRGQLLYQEKTYHKLPFSLTKYDNKRIIYVIGMKFRYDGKAVCCGATKHTFKARTVVRIYDLGNGVRI